MGNLDCIFRPLRIGEARFDDVYLGAAGAKPCGLTLQPIGKSHGRLAPRDGQDALRGAAAVVRLLGGLPVGAELQVTL